MKQDLLNAIRLIKDYCYDRSDCGGCIIYKWCNDNNDNRLIPSEWDLNTKEKELEK